MVAAPAKNDCGTAEAAENSDESPGNDESRLGRQLLRKWSDKLTATRRNLATDVDRARGPFATALGEAGFQLDDVIAFVDDARRTHSRP